MFNLTSHQRNLIKTTLRLHLNAQNGSYSEKDSGKDVGKRDLFCTAGGNVNESAMDFMVSLGSV